MKTLRILITLLLLVIVCFAQIGNSYQYSSTVVHPVHRHGASLNKIKPIPEPEHIFVGIPLLYQQRRELAEELGVNPYNLMGNRNDYMYRDHHPLEDDTSIFQNTGIHKPFRPSHRIVKRGIIWNKLKKITRGISKVKRKMWKIKSKAIRIIKGPKVTERPSYPSTGGSWGYSKGSSNGWRQRGVSMPLTGWSSPASGGYYRSPRSGGSSWFSEPNYHGLAVRQRL